METEPNQNSLSTPVAIVVAGALVAAAVFFGMKSNGVAPAAHAPAAPAGGAAVDISKVRIDGEPFVGDKNAPVTVAEWYDYQCPFCRRHTEETMPQIVKEYVDTGKVKIVFKDFQFLGPDSQALGQMSRAVWEVAPDKFYAWHTAVYKNQGTENTGWATPENIRSIALGVLGEQKTDEALALVKTKGAEYQKKMDADRAEGAGFGINGTPGFIIGSQFVSGAQPYSVFKQLIDLALKNS